MYGKIEYDPIRDAYLCEICHKWYRGLGYHIWQVHSMSTDKYKEMFGLEKKKSLIVESIAKQRRESALKHNAADNLTQAGWLGKHKGQAPIQKYKRSAETMARLKDLHKLRKFEKRRIKKIP